jgi:glycine/D-amino acid oxidase-like deaminating enzyme
MSVDFSRETGLTDTFGASLWSALTPPPVELPALEGDIEADVAIVGAGFLGLSLALHLAERGVAATLVEAREPGFGASGRNTGFVVPSLTGTTSPSELVPHLGEEGARKLARFVGGSGNFLFDLVRRLSIDCAAEQTGFLQPAHTPATVQAVERRVREWQALGQPVRLLDRAEAQRLTGSPRYAAALLDPTGGQINPLAYAHGLARASSAAGARLYARSPVQTIERREGGWRLGLPTGTLSASRVICTTNALVGDLLPSVRRSIIQARPYQVATQPLGEDVRRRILPERTPVADLHRHVFAYRWSPDSRLVTGGIAMLNDRGAVARMADYFLARLHRYLPGLPSLEAAFAWRGVVAATDHRIPQVWEVGPGLYAPIGCNGRGVALTTALGASLAGFLDGGDAEDLPIAIGPPQPKRFHAILNRGPSLWLGWSRMRDWLEDRATKG